MKEEPMADDDVQAAPFGPPPGAPLIDYPVPPRENMKLILEHKTPYWIPVMFLENTFCFNPNDGERPPLTESGKDWFGATWEFVETVGAQMVPPATHICPDPRDWREKLVFPDLDSIDFGKGKEKFLPMFDNSQKMNMYVMQNGMFERLLDIADSMEVFVWLKEEPEDAIAYANAMADYKIKVIDKVIDNWVPIDFFALSDDWGTQHAPFMSPEMYERIFFRPTKRIADHIHARGYYVNCHSCGKINDLVPYIAQFADMWEGQPMNDHKALKKKLGDRLAFTIHLDPAVAENPDATEGELVKAVRDSIDAYGYDGGMVMFSMGASPSATEIIAHETFEYSRKKFGKV
jgi:hypothetical protein